MYDSVTGQAFGPVIDGEDLAEAFLDHVRNIESGRDIRTIDPDRLTLIYSRWRVRQ
jgi:hypothetical protein